MIEELSYDTWLLFFFRSEGVHNILCYCSACIEKDSRNVCIDLSTRPSRRERKSLFEIAGCKSPTCDCVLDLLLAHLRDMYREMTRRNPLREIFPPDPHRLT